jgi:hypothetical protein
MTRDQAANIIADAITNLGQLANTLTPDAHAQRIAAALDALGLLCMATAPGGERSEANEIAEHNADQLQRSLAAHKLLYEDDLAKGRTTASERWASQRSRT